MIIYSSKDRGIYHAFNKGLKKTKGDLITILNSDDYLTNKFVLKKYIKISKQKNKFSIFKY